MYNTDLVICIIWFQNETGILWPISCLATMVSMHPLDVKITEPEGMTLHTAFKSLGMGGRVRQPALLCAAELM